MLDGERAGMIRDGRADVGLLHHLACVPVTDARPTTLILAWPQGHRPSALEAFARAATTVAAHRQQTPSRVDG